MLNPTAFHPTYPNRLSTSLAYQPSFYPFQTLPAFASVRQRAQSTLLAPYNQPFIEDRFLDPKRNLSAKQAVGLFMSGFALAFAGKWTLSGLFHKSNVQKEAVQAVQQKLETEKPDIFGKHEQNGVGRQQYVYQMFTGALDSIYRLASADPAQRKALLAYVGSGIIGYVGGSIVQGTQETMVRRKETEIRSRVITRLQDVVRQSIHSKIQLNNRLKDEVREQIKLLLNRHDIHDVQSIIEDVPVVESLDQIRNYAVVPTHRTLSFGSVGAAPLLSAGHAAGQPVSKLNSVDPLHVQKGVIFTVGALFGWAMQGLFKMVQDERFEGERVVNETIQFKDREAWMVQGMRSSRKFAIMLSVLGLSAAAKLGQLAIDGLREVEVTRVNAKTELDYQTSNWLTQDPAYHEIAEREAARNELMLLEKELPRLKANSGLLRERVQAILQNVGRNSAPAYYKMVPDLQLADARA